MRLIKKPIIGKPQIKTVIVGLDVSMTDTGYSVLDSDGTPIVLSDVKPNKKVVVRDIDRQLFILDTLTKNIEQDTMMADKVVIVIEDYAFGSQVGKMFTRAELVGMIKRMLFLKDYEIYLVAPTSMKKFITGIGNARKQEVIAAAKEKYGFEGKNDNICDALCLAKYCHAYLNGQNLNIQKIN